MERKHILITGGAGYKGVLLTEELLKRGFHVTVLDNFLYGYEPVLGFAGHKLCRIVKKDVRNLTKEDLKDYDIIYHLAAISGYPACEANPHSAQTINVTSTENLVNLLSDDQVIIYASTTSFYGKTGQEQNEDSIPTPVSLYGLTKYQAEQICMKHQNAISFRFATLFGLSRKMRCDLLLNDFVFKACKERSIVLFDAHSVRTFLHVRDAISAYVMAAENLEAFLGGIFNVGSNTMNYSKLDIAEKIKELLPHIQIIQTQLEDPDQRNFVINFDKIHNLGFQPSISLEDGIKELIALYSWYQPYYTYKTI